MSEEITEQKPNFPAKLIQLNLEDLKAQQAKDFEAMQLELRGMRVELAEVPNSASLTKLYEVQSKGWAYFERASEMFRQYLKYSSSVQMLLQQVELQYKQIFAQAAAWHRTNNGLEYKATKSSQEREALVESIIPDTLQKELQSWRNLAEQAKVNYQIIKSYMEQFKGIRETILVQLSIVKNLIALGDLKIDPEAARAFRVIEASYAPTHQDYADRAEDSTIREIGMEEGLVKL